MGRCNNCRYWTRPLYDDKWRRTFGTCKGIPFEPDCEEWNDEDEGNGRFPPKIKEKCRGAMAYTRDADAYYAGLYTCPEFGCAKFKEKSND